MRILVNATNLRLGGGVQKAVEFVRASLASPGDHEFRYALSDLVARNLPEGAKPQGPEVLITDRSPARPLGGRDTVRALREMEERFRPDVVFSVFGPTYTRFSAPHLMGFAVGWITHPNRYAWGTLKNPLSRARSWGWNQRTAWWARYADRWVLETEVAADGLARVLGVDRGRCYVVPNLCGEHYFRAAAGGAQPEPRMARRAPSDFHLLVFSAWYPHKNLELVPAVAAELKRRDPERQYRFFFTFDPSSAPWRRIHSDAVRRGVEASLTNLGTIPVEDGPRAYLGADALFLPTLLESYTATYPEAMCMRRPIVTTDLPFAREICGDAAAYFAPMDAGSAAERILTLARDESSRLDLVRRGEARLAAGPTQAVLYERMIELLEATASG